MKKPTFPARDAALLLLACLLAAAPTLNCGGSSNGSGKGGSGGGGTAGGGAAGGGGHGGSAGAGGASGAGGQAGLGGHAGGSGGAAGVGGHAGVGGGAVADGGVDAVAFDGGSDCISPTGEALLDATAAGLPASGLVLWLRGDRGVYKTAANAVCGWADQSGHGAILTPYGARPTWSATGLAGLPAVHSTTGGQGLSTSGVLGIPAQSARTFVAVVQLVSTTSRFNAVHQGNATTPGTYLGLDTNSYNTAGAREGVYMTNNAYDSALATTTASPRIHVYTISAMTVGTPVLPGIDYRVDGVTQTLTRNPGGLGNGNFEDFSSANYTSVVTAAEGIVAEVLAYDRALTVTERGAVETALKARYGIGQ